jgi:hypothetical protein
MGPCVRRDDRETSTTTPLLRRGLSIFEKGVAHLILIEGATRYGSLRSQGRQKDVYTDAVVTPPSTTMVWPVMKLEASEPR